MPYKKSAVRKGGSKNPQLPTSSSPQLPTSSSTGVMLAWLIALLVARWSLPTEGAAEGLTLWLVQLVLFTAVVRTAWAWRFGDRPARFDWIDGAMGMLISAQVISALVVVLTVGNARAAINVAWEWVGSGVLIWLLRHELKTARVMRELCVGLTLTAAVLAGYGLWQHYVWYPQMVREYEQVLNEEQSLTGPNENGQPRRLSASDTQRLARLRAEMTQQGIPTEASSRMLWEQRLKASREPIGLFALANSFAGLLLAAILIQMELLAAQWSLLNAKIPMSKSQCPNRRNWLCLVCSCIGLGVTAYCFLLTKSRTAWVGLLAGIAWWGLHALMAKFAARPLENSVVRTQTPSDAGIEPSSVARRSSLVTWAVIGFLMVGIAVTFAAVSGGLDKAVLSEAPKSLRYRLEYWQGTWGTIREHFWLGTGPGNFREHFLKHKLAESSEEIADPHNFVLDVWANAGTLGLIGLMACVALMVRTWVRPTLIASESQRFTPLRLPLTRTLSPEAGARGPDTERGGVVSSTASEEMRFTSPAVWGAGLSFPLAAVGMELLGHGTDERLWWLGGIWWLIWLGLAVWQRQARVPTLPTVTFGSLPTALEAANVALLVHLLGAGGIAMPAITQLLCLVWVLQADWGQALRNSELAAAGMILGESSVWPIPNSEVPDPGRSSNIRAASVWSERVWLVLMAVALILSGSCLISGSLPELTCRTKLGLGDSAWETRNFASALEKYKAAAVADRFALEPVERQAELAAQRAEQTNDAADINAADGLFRVLIGKQPFAPHPHRRLGQFWLSHFERTHDAESARRATESFAAAVERYPYHATLLSEWALACDGAGRSTEACRASRQALRQDSLNRHAGHVDKFLNAKVHRQMEDLAAVCDPERPSTEAN